MPRSLPRVHAPLLGMALLAGAAGVSAQALDAWRNVTAGGPLRHGVYGRIEVRHADAAPPLIYARPVIASERVAPTGARPVYLYVPPGQVRKWSRHCAKWSACDEPVLFVRMDASPSRWGQWRQHREDREDVALQQREAH